MITTQDNQTLEKEIQLLMKAIANMQSEQLYIKELREGVSDGEEETKEADGEPIKSSK